MKRTALVVVLVLALTFAFAASAFATTGKFFANSTSYYQWNKPAVIPPGTSSPAGLYNIGDNPTNPGAHANYLATTAKCGMCHSVHRAAGGTATKLLPTSDATCAGCHTGGTAITAKIVTWTPYDITWKPAVASDNPTFSADGGVAGPTWQKAWHDWVDAGKPSATSEPTGTAWAVAKAAVNNTSFAGGAANGGGPHNDSAWDLVVDGLWDGTGTTPEASYEARYGCFTRRCHATNPHGADSSKYKIFAAKLLFNESANDDEFGDGTYGGLDAVWDNLGATDAAVERFVLKNSSVMSTTSAGDIRITREGTTTPSALDANETHALVAGLTCGRPSNPSTGEDECHAEASYAIIDKRIKEDRNAGMGMTDSTHRTDNTGGEALGFGGNDHRTEKTGHVAGTFAARNADGSYAPIAGCTSCHDQTDAGNSVFGHFTFPHGQVAYGGSNLTTNGVNPLPAQAYDPAKYAFDATKSDAYNAGANAPRSRIWAGYSGSFGTTMTYTAGTNQKAYDGQCLKCHRTTNGTVGIGKTL